MSNYKRYNSYQRWLLPGNSMSVLSWSYCVSKKELVIDLSSEYSDCCWSSELFETVNLYHWYKVALLHSSLMERKKKSSEYSPCTRCWAVRPPSWWQIFSLRTQFQRLQEIQSWAFPSMSVGCVNLDFIWQSPLSISLHDRFTWIGLSNYTALTTSSTAIRLIGYYCIQVEKRKEFSKPRKADEVFMLGRWNSCFIPHWLDLGSSRLRVPKRSCTDEDLAGAKAQQSAISYIADKRWSQV